MIDLEKMVREAGLHRNDHTSTQRVEAAKAFAALVLEAAAVQCESERVDYESTQDRADEAYNMATSHCADAIRAMKPGESDE